MSTPTKNITNLILILLIGMTFVACGGSANNTPEAVYKKMTVAAKNQNCLELWENFDVKSQGLIEGMMPLAIGFSPTLAGDKAQQEKLEKLTGKDQFLYMCKNEKDFANDLIKNTDFAVIQTQNEADNAVLTIKHTGADPEVVVMVKENGKWKYNITYTEAEDKKFQEARKAEIKKANEIALDDVRNTIYAQEKLFKTKKKYANSIKELVDNGVELNVSNYSKLFTSSYDKGKSYCVYGFHPDGNRFRRYYGPNRENIDSLSKDEMLFAAVAVAMNDDQVDFIKSLIDKGANVNFKSDKGFPVLHMAIFNNCPSITKVLLDSNANVNLKDDNNGGTALMMACYLGKTDIVKELLAKGADVNVKSKQGEKTPLSLAKEKSHTDIIKLLEDAGAKG